MQDAFETCKKFILSFCDDIELDIDKLKDFCFMDLKLADEDDKIKELNKQSCKKECIIRNIETSNKKIYGLYFLKNSEPKYKHSYSFEDCDDMNIVRAIYYVLYYDKIPKDKIQYLWNSLNWEDNVNNTNIYRGETINSFNTLISDNPQHQLFYIDYFNDDMDFVRKITRFRRKLFTIGNFMILPNLKLNGYRDTLNTYKGCQMGDYFDLFLIAIKEQNNEYINDLAERNKEIFSFDFKKFIQQNYLQDYVDENYNINFNMSKHFKHWEIKKEQKEEYKQFINEYIETVECKINQREKRVLDELKEKLK